MSDLLALSKRVIQRGEQTELKALATAWNQQGRALKKQGATLTAALNELDPHLHTLAVAHLLEAEISNTNLKQIGQQQVNWLIQQLHNFFATFQSWQIHETSTWSLVWSLARDFFTIAQTNKRDSAPLSSFRQTCRVLSEVFPHSLTIIHTYFVVLSVRTKHYRAALDVVNRSVYSIVPRSHIDSVELLNYFYFSGLIHAANKQWSQAYDSFYMCLSVPGNAVSAIQIAAYKKLVLTSIISNNDMPDLSQRAHSSNLIRSLEQASQQYLDLSKSFEKQLSNQPSSNNKQPSSNSSNSNNQSTHSSLSSHIAHVAETLNNDRNYGLALELDKHLFERRIQRLTRTYITLELSEMAKLVGASSLDNLEATVNRLINAGVIGARINQMTGLCEFVDQQDSSEYNEHQTQRLQDQISELCVVLQALQRKQRNIERNPIYIAKQLLQSQGDERGGSSSSRARHGGANNEDWELNTAIAESLRTS